MANATSNPEFEALRTLFRAAWNFLNVATFNKQKLTKLPWYWLLGPTNAGKTFLINQAELSLIDSKSLATNPGDESASNKRCNWWFSDKATLLDIPGHYLTNETSQVTQAITWRNFITIAQKYIKKKPPAGIIFTLPILEWLEQTKSEQQALIHNLRQALLHLRQQIANIYCPVYLVLTKIDKINGFSEFFADLGQEERQSAWGFHLTHDNVNPTSLPGLLKKHLDLLVKRLQDRVIWRVHQERNLQKRVLIQHFPWQLENLKNSLADFLYQLGDILELDGSTPLQGVYFTSSLQPTTPIDATSKPAEEIAVSPYQEMLFANAKQTQPYFIQQLLQKTIFPHATKVHQVRHHRRHHKLHTALYVIATSLVVAFGFTLFQSFNTKIAQINAAEIDFANYRLLAKQLPTIDANFNHTLPILNALQQSANLLHQAHLPWLIQDLSRADTLTTLTDNTYHQALSRYFLPGLAASLEPTLMSGAGPSTLYGALRIYLMLGDPSHFNADEIKSWFIKYWQQTYPDNPELQTKLISHLNALLLKPAAPLELNQQLITKARSVLSLAPASQLAYSMLTNHINDDVRPFQSSDNKNIDDFSGIFTLKSNHIVISTLYTGKQFQKTYFEVIPAICGEIFNGDWVLGFAPHPNLATESKAGLTGKVRQIYLQEYATHWQKLLTNFEIAGWQDDQRALITLNTLVKNQFVITQVLQTIADNTALNHLVAPTFNISTSDIQIIQTNLASKFQELNNLLPDGKQAGELKQIFANIDDLRNYFVPIAQASDSNKAAFFASKLRFEKNLNNDPIHQLLISSVTAPQPLQRWLHTLANNVWHLMLQHSERYLNKVWQKEVVAYYNENLNNRYPLFKPTKQEVALDAFAHFFGPEGIMDRYFKEYLNPFIDTSEANWQYRTVEGQTLHFTPELIVQLERASIIRTMFFNADHQLDVNFSLQPMALEPGVARLTLTLNDQTMQDRHNSTKAIHKFSWPDLSRDQTTILTFIDSSGKQASTAAVGPWSLFKLLDKANLQATDNTKNYVVTFDLNGNAARYRLMAESVINPFIPGIMEGFRCPVNLNMDTTKS